ncbi:hypothetical protein SAMN06295885_0761 [Rathayibacter oskolensis]|uniref:VWFA domain-containing protein n=1 Tax=Rathayibacter oskolensis TaxID=1891671 RepID=A0A1X7N7S4_9MICO|nr:VWA domain-containing protein [Rathayibacter oskolensis]SMH32612.1 hypothetical protein SAMN06295885_0761 [Rathayibacter oskolensis]
MGELSDKYFVMPFYIVVDVSYSMEENGGIRAMPQLVPAIRTALAEKPLVHDILRISILEFAGTANVLVPMSRPNELGSPDFAVRGDGTNYAAALALLKERIIADVATLKSQNLDVYRPAVFFLTDGEPNVGPAWEKAFAELTYFDPATGAGFKAYPLFVPLGVGAASRTVLGQMAFPPDVSRLYMAVDPAAVQAAIIEMANVMAHTTVSSGNTAVGALGSGGSEEPQHVLPDERDLGPGVTVSASQYQGGSFI